MKNLKRLSIPMLLGLLLIGAVVGVASARPDARPQQQAWRVLAVSPFECVPDNPGDSWNFTTGFVDCKASNCELYCPADFPAAGEQAVGAVNVKRATMYAYDNGAGGVYFELMKTYAPNGVRVSMANNSTSNSANDPQVVMDMSIINNPVYRVQAPFIYLSVTYDATSNPMVYGFFIHYTW